VIVYVETNFVLELAYEQEEHEDCEKLLELVRGGRHQLIVPVFALAEARLAWDRLATQRHDFERQLQEHVRQLSRSEQFKNLRDDSRDLVSALVLGGSQIRAKLEETIRSIGSLATTLPLTVDVLGSARLYEEEYGFRPPDAMVYASVLSHARTLEGAKLLIARDKAFALPSVRDHLSEHGVRVIAGFGGGTAFLENER
jgi:predicted nucleic acid-binding protein